MATKTVTIYASGSAFVDRANPNKVDISQSIVTQGYDQKAFEQFVPPSSIQGKRVVSASLYVYIKYNPSFELSSPYYIFAISNHWTPEKTTWNNQPSYYGNGNEFKWQNLNSDGFGWGRIDIQDEINWDLLAHIVSFGLFINGYYTYYTANSDHKPYIVLTYEDNVEAGLYAVDLSPNGCFVDERDGVRLDWSAKYKLGTIEPTYYQKIVASWSSSLGSYSKDITANSLLPGNQFPVQGNVSWAVTITDSAGNVNTSQTATFTTTDSTLYASPISPINAYIDGSEQVPFNWHWDISTGTRPTRADLQTSMDGGITWKDLGSVTNQNDLTYYAAPGTLPAGNILWRIRGYNTDGIAGPWSDPAPIVVRQAPNAPIISNVTTNPKPAVSWQAEGQQAYQLQIKDWDSGPVFGTAKTDQCPEFLPDGPAIIRLRVQNNFGLWSQWTETSITIRNRPGAAITLRTRTVLGGVRLIWITDGKYPAYHIYRDGEIVGITDGKEYTDFRGNGKMSYIIRGVNADSTYTDSAPEIEILIPKSGLIAQDGVWDWMLLDRRISARPARSGSEEADTYLSYYSGRTFPVAELSGHRHRTRSYTYSLPTLEDVGKLADMSGTIVVYKHRDGELARGLLGGVSWAWNRRRWDVSFTITEVDHGTVF